MPTTAIALSLVDSGEVLDTLIADGSAHDAVAASEAPLIAIDLMLPLVCEDVEAPLVMLSLEPVSIAPTVEVVTARRIAM